MRGLFFPSYHNIGSRHFRLKRSGFLLFCSHDLNRFLLLEGMRLNEGLLNSWQFVSLQTQLGFSISFSLVVGQNK